MLLHKIELLLYKEEKSEPWVTFNSIGSVPGTKAD